MINDIFTDALSITKELNIFDLKMYVNTYYGNNFWHVIKALKMKIHTKSFTQFLLFIRITILFYLKIKSKIKMQII